jgi:hypothetical protein
MSIDTDAESASTNLSRIAKAAKSEKWRDLFNDRAGQVGKLEDDADELKEVQEELRQAENRIDDLEAQLNTEDAYEKEQWIQAVDLFDEAHRALGHASAVTLCSHELCKRISKVVEGPRSWP